MCQTQGRIISMPLAMIIDSQQIKLVPFSELNLN